MSVRYFLLATSYLLLKFDVETAEYLLRINVPQCHNGCEDGSESSPVGTIASTDGSASPSDHTEPPLYYNFMEVFETFTISPEEHVESDGNGSMSSIPELQCHLSVCRDTYPLPAYPPTIINPLSLGETLMGIPSLTLLHVAMLKLFTGVSPSLISRLVLSLTWPSSRACG